MWKKIFNLIKLLAPLREADDYISGGCVMKEETQIFITLMSDHQTRLIQDVAPSSGT